MQDLILKMKNTKKEIEITEKEKKKIISTKGIIFTFVTTFIVIMSESLLISVVLCIIYYILMSSSKNNKNGLLYVEVEIKNKPKFDDILNDDKYKIKGQWEEEKN